jgi:hypothetical protein
LGHLDACVETLIMPVRSCAQCIIVRVPKYEHHRCRSDRETRKTEVKLNLRFQFDLK